MPLAVPLNRAVQRRLTALRTACSLNLCANFVDCCEIVLISNTNLAPDRKSLAKLVVLLVSIPKSYYLMAEEMFR